MDTAKTRADSREAPRGLAYDGFISYSHAADNLLAPRLQAGLQRFAKPWWKRRALRIFRDEASLSANPHLWSSIIEALDGCGWFILLLSTDAAESEWVDREVEYWVEHKDPERIIPVLTDGDFSWVDGHIISDATPPALAAAFRDEPRWVDLRFARTDEQLDLNNAAFRGAIADVASAIRGVPKDELESEEVRQHRRTVRTAWGAGIALLALVLLASTAAVYAVGQQNRADDLAGQEAEARQVAVEATEAEAEARALAEEEAQRAFLTASRMLDFVLQQLNSEIDPPGLDYELADSPIALPVVESPPDTGRLDFLQKFCVREATCNRDAQFVHPKLPLAGPGFWLAGRPFHIRHGFVNESVDPLVGATPGDGYDLRVFVTRREGPELRDGAFPLDQTYRFHPDYLVREISDRCGPGYETQIGPLPCDVFVHEFSDGLPPGRYDFWVEWHAPCSVWVETAVCPAVGKVLSLYNSNVNTAFFHDDFTPLDDDYGEGIGWPADPWDYAEPLS
jgi:hypothetical protein